MSTPEVLFVISTAVVAFVVIALFVVRNTPSRGNSTQSDTWKSENERFARTVDRPAGPDAEDGALDPEPAAALADEEPFIDVRR